MMSTRFASAFSLAALLLTSTACDDGGHKPCPDCKKDRPAALDEPVVDWDGTPVGSFGQLRVEDGFLRNEAGEVVQLKGVSSMWLNWEATGYAESRDALEWMRDNWHVGILRAAMGIEPSGAYLSDPEKALEQVRTIVNNAIDLDMYVIIDWHDHNAHEHTEKAVEFFGMMAEEFGDTPNVLYETYNEPENVSWSDVLVPYHTAVIKRIRKHDPDNIIILGTPTWCQDVDEAAMDRIEGTNLMYALHFYACSHKASFRDRANSVLRGRLPLFVTEWGATHADGGTERNPGVCEEDAQEWHDWMDRNAVSWTAWKLDDCQDSSCLFREGAPVDGPFDDDWLQGHGPFVKARLLDK